MEDQIKRLKQERSTLKTKVKVAAISLERSIQQEQHDQIETNSSNVQGSFNYFITFHFEYEDLLNSSDDFSSYKVVNSLDLDDYYSKVKELHDNALSCYTKYQAKKLDKQGSVLLSKADVMLKDLDAIISSNQVTNVPATNTLLDKANVVLESMNTFFEQYGSSSSLESVSSKLSACILNLDTNIYKVMQLLNATTSPRFCSLPSTVNVNNTAVEQSSLAGSSVTGSGAGSRVGASFSVEAGQSLSRPSTLLRISSSMASNTNDKSVTENIQGGISGNDSVTDQQFSDLTSQKEGLPNNQPSVLSINSQASANPRY